MHKRNDRADEHGDGKHIESILHEEKRKARSTTLSKGDRSSGRRGREVGQKKGELWKEAEQLECDCWNVLLGRCVRSYMHGRWQPECPILYRSSEQVVDDSYCNCDSRSLRVAANFDTIIV